MGKKQKFVDWAEERKQAEAEDRQPTRKELERKLLRRKNKRPLIQSSHKGGQP